MGFTKQEFDSERGELNNVEEEEEDDDAGFDFDDAADEVLDEPQGGMDDVVGGDKVYHVDMVRKITHRCGSDLERFRIVLTHAGIRRIDEIKPLFITTGDNYH